MANPQSRFRDPTIFRNGGPRNHEVSENGRLSQGGEGSGNSESLRVADRFWSKVDKDGPIPAHAPELGPCWVWTAAVGPHGYGMFRIGGTMRRAHRVAYGLGHGVDPSEAGVLHRCDNTACVRPTHLFLGDQLANHQDRIAKGRGRIAVADSGVALDILARGGRGETDVQIARSIGVKRGAVRCVLLRETWRHVEFDGPTWVPPRQRPEGERRLRGVA